MIPELEAIFTITRSRMLCPFSLHLSALFRFMAPYDAARRAKEAQTAAEFAEAQRLLNGPAGNPECVWLGRRVVSLLWRHDMDTAFRHLDLYDRFGCPGGHIEAAFRCLVLNGNIDPKNPESLNGRVQACWVNPSLLAPPASAAVPGGATH